MPRFAIIILSLLSAACTAAPRPKSPQKHQAAPVLPVPAADPLKALDAKGTKWVDSVFSKLSADERIGQLFMVAAYSGGPAANGPAIEKLIRAHQIGGLIFMQGGPARQALQTNKYQKMAQVPLLLAMDAEWGLGMRLDSIINLPRQSMLGATNDSALAYKLGTLIAFQCKRLGVHVDFAPVVDVNNNPMNPVINARSFGEDKERVARLGIAYMRGLQDHGIMACAKHFPGHGDVSVDSHLDLPVISKSRAGLDTLELYPFRRLTKAGVQSMMVAHLSVPALETANRVPTTLSKNTITNLLRKDLGFEGLVFTDAMDMKGVAKYYQPGEADAKAIEAGNDVLVFSQDVPAGTAAIKASISAGRVSQTDIDRRVKRILAAKYRAGLSNFQPIDPADAVRDINDYTAEYNNEVAQAAITKVRDRQGLLPLKDSAKVLYIALGGAISSDLQRLIDDRDYRFTSVSVSKNGSPAAAETAIAKGGWDAIVVSVQGLSFYPGKDYGLSAATLKFLEDVSAKQNVIVAMMGNAYALRYVCNAGTLICGYEDLESTGNALAKLLRGYIRAEGQLPVTPPCLKK
jgi:beta-glucosidase-like glycosyl hydrolase